MSLMKRRQRLSNKKNDVASSSSCSPSFYSAPPKYLYFNYTIALKSILITALLVFHTVTIVQAKSNWSYNNVMNRLNNHNKNKKSYHRVSLLLKNIETRMNKEFQPPSVPLFTSTTSVPFSIPHLNVLSFSTRKRSGSSSGSFNDNDATDEPYSANSDTDTLANGADNSNGHADNLTYSNDPAKATPKSKKSSNTVNVSTQYVTNTARGGSSVDSTTSSSEEHNNDGYPHNSRHSHDDTNEINNYHQHSINRSEGENGEICDTDNIDGIEDIEDIENIDHDLEEVEEYNISFSSSSSYGQQEDASDAHVQLIPPKEFISASDYGYGENYRNVINLDARAHADIILEEDDTNTEGDDNDDDLSVYDMTEELFQDSNSDEKENEDSYRKLDLNLNYDNDNHDIFIHHQAVSSIEENDLDTEDDDFLQFQQEGRVENEGHFHDLNDIDSNDQIDDGINDGIADNSHNIIIDTMIDDDNDDHSDISDGGFFDQGGEESNEERIITMHEEEPEGRNSMDELEEVNIEEEVEAEEDTKTVCASELEYTKEGQEEGMLQENKNNDNNDPYNYDSDIMSQDDHHEHKGMNEVIYEDETNTNSNHHAQELCSRDNHDHVIDVEDDDVHEDIEMNDVIDDVIGDVDYPSGSDSAAFVDRMDLADAYDDGIFTDIMGGDTDIAEEYPAESIPSNIQGINMNFPNIVQTNTGPTVQYIITENMRRCLVRKLGYSPMEVSHMKADVAAVVVSKMLKRPKIGMPSEFYIDGTAPAMKRRWGTQSQKVIRQAILPTILTGISLYCRAFIKPKVATEIDEKEVELFKNSKGEAQISPSITTSIDVDNETKKGSSSISKSDINTKISTPSPSFPKQSSKVAKKEASVQRSYEPTLMKRRTKPSITSMTENMEIIEEPIEEEDVLEEDEVVGTLVEDPDKSIVDKAITFTLEKIDEVFRRPF